MNTDTASHLDRDSFAGTIENPNWQYWLVFEGDWGGQIYLSVPWLLVGPKACIHRLLTDMDRCAWGCNGGDGASADLHSPDRDIAGLRLMGMEVDSDFEASIRTSVSGGMGGGKLLDRLWTCQAFDSPEWLARIVECLDIQTSNKESP